MDHRPTSLSIFHVSCMLTWPYNQRREAQPAAHCCISFWIACHLWSYHTGNLFGRHVICDHIILATFLEGMSFVIISYWQPFWMSFVIISYWQSFWIACHLWWVSLSHVRPKGPKRKHRTKETLHRENKNLSFSQMLSDNMINLLHLQRWCWITRTKQAAISLSDSWKRFHSLVKRFQSLVCRFVHSRQDYLQSWQQLLQLLQQNVY